jgi:membrane protease YdiL (CAAX protease family)
MPAQWLRILILYPLIAVYPQELFYRAFVFERYRPLFPTNISMLLASSIAFAFAHIVFRNWQAPLLTLAGGLIFGYRYLTTRSLLLVTIEHALWGLLVLSIGLENRFLLPTSYLLKAQ